MKFALVAPPNSSKFCHCIQI